ncbi:MAG: hypothetical protein WC900_10085, partial [Oscillospiraceae bacterium]
EEKSNSKDKEDNGESTQTSTNETNETNGTNGTNGKITQSDIEILTRDSDKDYFSPITDDYIYCIYKTEGEDQRACLTSYDSDGNLVQYVKRSIFTGLLTGNYIPNEDDFIVGDTIYEDIGKLYGLDDYNDSLSWKAKMINVWSLEFDESSFIGQGPIESYYISKKPVPDDTKFKNIYSLSDFEELQSIDFATDDYKIERHEKISQEEYIVDWDLMIRDLNSPYNMATVPVREYGAYSYEGTNVYAFNENGQVIEVVDIKKFDEPGMVDEYLKYSYENYFDITGVSPTEQWIHETVLTDESKEMINEDYELVTDTYLVSRRTVDLNENDDRIDWKQNGTIDLDYKIDDVTARYYSKPYLTEQQIAFGVNR